jgi:hypothetical protein
MGSFNQAAKLKFSPTLLPLQVPIATATTCHHPTRARPPLTARPLVPTSPSLAHHLNSPTARAAFAAPGLMRHRHLGYLSTAGLVCHHHARPHLPTLYRATADHPGCHHRVRLHPSKEEEEGHWPSPVDGRRRRSPAVAGEEGSF